MAGVLQLPERLTQVEAADCLAGLSRQMRAGAGWELDASALADFDSAALAVLLALQRDAQAAGATLRVRGMSDRLRELVALYGVGELLPA